MLSDQDVSVATGLYSTPKNIVIENCRKTILKMEKEVQDLERQEGLLEPDSFEYFRWQKRIARRRQIIKDCEQTIVLMKSQIKLQTNPIYRGL